MSTNATASRTTTNTDDGYTTFSICSRWRLNAKPGSRVSCVGMSRPPEPGGRLVDKLRFDGSVLRSILRALPDLRQCRRGRAV